MKSKFSDLSIFFLVFHLLPVVLRGEYIDEGNVPEGNIPSHRWRRAAIFNGTQQNAGEKYVSLSELSPFLDRFTMSGVERFSAILFDTTNYQIIVGARDHLFRLSLVGLSLLESAQWSSDRETVQMCKLKGRSSEKCHNFVLLLQMSSDGRIYACGTNSFNPVCTWRGLSQIGRIDSEERGIGRSPLDPSHSLTSVMASDDSLYVGTSLDYLGREGSILRPLGPGGFLRTSGSNSKWLSEPNFISSFETEGFVYFLFNENAVEAINCGKRMYPRIGRVCKSDEGGSIVLKENWTTFLKSRLNCSRPGEYPFYYHQLTSVVYLPRDQIIYALFTTQENSLPGSAVCAFSMSSVNSSFEGPFKHQEGPSSAWKPHNNEDAAHFRCDKNGRTSYSRWSSRRSRSTDHFERSFLRRSRRSADDEESLLADKYQLMDEAVQPLTQSPVLELDFMRLGHIAVDVVSTRQSGEVHVAFVAGDDGMIRKITILPRNRDNQSPDQYSKRPTVCMLEVLSPFEERSSKTIRSFKFLKETNSLYVGTDTSLTRIPIDRCERHRRRYSCIAAMDPYCGWDSNALRCTTAPSNNPMSDGWYQNVIGCPDRTEPVDGGWSDWSVWEPCLQSGSDDTCLCRRRECSAPEPARGGTNCFGVKTEVRNCTTHGGWTTWSAWSQCSATCGIAVKTRRRTCSNPVPKFGGRVCVGEDSTEIYCHSLPPCPIYTHLPVDGGWSDWTEWTPCSTKCGKGTKYRHRNCTQPNPRYGGIKCSGCDHELEECLGSNCSPAVSLSAWSPWLILQNSQDGSAIQRRYRTECRAIGDETGGISVSSDGLYHEDRRCGDGECSSPYVGEKRGGGWSEWSLWSDCSLSCGGGVQKRKRTCSGVCSGSTVEERVCNAHDCQGHWSCWSEWTTCSSKCGSGDQERVRRCVTLHDPLKETGGCIGQTTQHRPCTSKACEGEEGWGSWTDWTECGIEGDRIRTRKCLSRNPSTCKGLDLQRMTCDLIDKEGDATYMEASAVLASLEGYVSVQTLAGSCLACLFVGALMGAVIVYTLITRRKLPPVPSSPHFFPAKPNHYVSVPGADWKGTEHGVEDTCPIKSPTLSSKNGFKNSIKNAITALPMKEFDTATIKRSSHGSYGNGHIRADLESDTIFFS